jgi:hypothetical protein
VKLSEDDLPFTFNCFTSQASTTHIINFNCEYNLSSEKIKHIDSLVFTLNSNSKATFKCEESEAAFEDNGLVWRISDLNEDKAQATLEIKTKDDPSFLFPIDISLINQSSILKAEAQAYDEKGDIMLQFEEKLESSDFKVSYD